MTSDGGHWIRVRFAGGGERLDWVPNAQAPSPNGSVGRWHVVPDPAGGDSRWEWHPRSAVSNGSVFKLPAPPVETPVPAWQPIAAVPAPPLTEPDGSLTQPLPLQAVPNRRPKATAPSVFANVGKAAKARKAGVARIQPVRVRWAAWSLSVVLAVPVVFLLTRHSDNDPAATSAQTALNPSSDTALGTGTDPDQTVTGTPLTGTGTPGTTTTDTTDTTTSSPGLGTSATPGNAAVASYLSHLYNLDATQGYTFASLGDSALTSIGNAACGSLDRGATYDAVRVSTMQQIPNGGQVVLAAAVTYLCPAHHAHHAQLQEYTAQQMAGTSSPDVAAG